MAAATASPTPPDTSTSFSLDVEGGDGITLTGRALPYLPLTITGKQRAEFTWYPGSPQATVQMLGPEEGVITIAGFWKDRFIAGSGEASLSSSAGTSLNTSGSRGFASVAELVAHVDTMRRMGQSLKLTWAGLIRYGHITSFTQTWHNVHDCEWELEFSVLSQESTTVVPGTVPAVNLAQVAMDAATERDGFQQGAFGVDPALDTSGAFDVRNPAFGAAGTAQLGLLESLSATLDQIDTAITVFSSSVASYAQQATAFITAVPDAARSVMASCDSAIRSISNAAGNITDKALTEWYAIASPDGVDGVPFGLQVGAASYRRRVGDSVRSTLAFCAVTRYQMAAQLQTEPVQTFTAPADMDLRDVSRQFYGTPNEWRFLMTYNNLTTSRLPIGWVIIIPQLPADTNSGSSGRSTG